ncbi:hypothetical protein D1903_16290 [Escherichia coli]|nr:hypothetical protein D1903_16290 [Escherichia coli]HAJ3067504.1 hypothetical protein [Escherichia coli]
MIPVNSIKHLFSSITPEKRGCVSLYILNIHTLYRNFLEQQAIRSIVMLDRNRRSVLNESD